MRSETWLPTARYAPRAFSAAIAASLVAAAACLITPQPAGAGHNVFHIFTPHVEAGHWGAEALSAFHMGLPRHAVDEGEDEAEHDAHDEHDAHASPRAAVELGLHTGVTDLWMAKLALVAEHAAGGDLELTGIEFANVFRFAREASGPLDLAWFTALDFGLDAGASNAVVFGPIFSFSSGPLALVLNPFLEKSFGENREEGIAFAYAARLTYEIGAKLHVGLEAYGEVENLGHAPAVRDQIHRIGPVVYLGTLHGAHAHSAAHDAHRAHLAQHQARGGHDPGEWYAEVGLLLGLTEATPDAALKFNLGLDF